MDDDVDDVDDDWCNGRNDPHDPAAMMNLLEDDNIADDSGGTMVVIGVDDVDTSILAV